MSLTEDLKKVLGVQPRFPHVERELAHAYGLAPDVLKDVRSALLQRATHWDLVKGLVCYNDAGRALLEAGLKIVPEKIATEPAPGATPPPQADPATASDSAANTTSEELKHLAGKKFAAARTGEVRTLVVVAKVRNKRILKAHDQDRVAWVRVRDSKNFRAGMELQAKCLSDELWELVGRCPRWNGKL